MRLAVRDLVATPSQITSRQSLGLSRQPRLAAGSARNGLLLLLRQYQGPPATAPTTTMTRASTSTSPSTTSLSPSRRTLSFDGFSAACRSNSSISPVIALSCRGRPSISSVFIPGNSHSSRCQNQHLVGARVPVVQCSKLLPSVQKYVP